ncbi:MAG: (Fe-S)-binding protein [bacterium]
MPVVHIIAYSVVFLTAMFFFARSIRARIGVLQAAQSQDTRGDVGTRLLGVIVNVFGQARLLRGDFSAGLMHFVIFWGFMVLMLNTLHFLIAGFFPTADLHIPLLGREDLLGGVYLFLRDLVEVLVLVAVIYAAFRRLVLKPKRLTQSSEAVLILGLIGTLMVTDILMNAAAVSAGEHSAHPLSFIESSLASAIPAASAGLTITINWWIHCLALLFFLNLLPLGKHFHVITSFFTVYLRNLKPQGQLPAIDFENEDLEEFGVHHIQQLHWGNWLDTYSCTECGRCDHFCPANRTGKTLSPKQIIIGTREMLYAHTPDLLLKLAAARRMEGSAAEGGGVAVVERLSDEELGGKSLVGDVHTDQALWACTTCGACDEHCPLFIEHVTPIVEMRRHLVLEEEGRFPKELQGAFEGLEGQGNPWGLPAHTRMEWAEGLDVPTLEEKPDAEWIYFVGCLSSFDDRNKETARALVQLLNHAGVSFAVLSSEACSGDPARRAGHEYLANALMQMNAEQFNEAKVKRVITTCPHCFNTLKVEYEQVGVVFEEVIHHSELLTRLVHEGRLKPEHSNGSQRIVFHDSCYLGRYNKVYDEPRSVVASLPGVQLVEAEYNRDKGFCCGAGGGRMFMEEVEGQRVNEWRYDQLTATGADEVAVACPFCNVMMSDAANAEGHEHKPVKDIAILLRDAVLGYQTQGGA